MMQAKGPASKCFWTSNVSNTARVSSWLDSENNLIEVLGVQKWVFKNASLMLSPLLESLENVYPYVLGDVWGDIWNDFWSDLLQCFGCCSGWCLGWAMFWTRLEQVWANVWGNVWTNFLGSVLFVTMFSQLLKTLLKVVHSVLERIWVKGSYLSKWLPQGERGPPKE